MELEYIHWFYNIILIVLFVLAGCVLAINNRVTFQKCSRLISLLLLIFTVVYFGSRDLVIGVDTINYKGIFDDFQHSSVPNIKIDFFFFVPLFIFSKILSYRIILYIWAFLYLIFALKAFKNLSKEYYLYFFLLFMISPYFFQFGINGIRNGIAASIFLYGLSLLKNNNKKGYKYAMIFSIGTHISMIVPFLIFIFVRRKNNVYVMLLAWVSIFSLVLLGGSYWILEKISAVLLSNGFLSGYLSNIDFDISKELRNYLFYGLPVVLWVVLFYEILKKKNIFDSFYFSCASSYILLSTIYLVFIYAAFAVRFAFLSDFLLPIVLFYPLFIIYNKKSNLKLIQLLSISVMLVLLFVKS